MVDNNPGNKLLPPYVAFVSLLNFVDGLKRGIPGQIDRSLMKTMSGSMQAQMMSALKYLHLIDAHGVVQDDLTRLVNSEGPERMQTLRELLTSSYPFLFSDFDLKKATSSQFRQKFTEAGATGDSVRKCIAFFLSAARDAGVEVSPYIADTVRQPTDTKPRKPVSKPARTSGYSSKGNVPQEQVTPPTNPISWKQMLLAKFPSFDPAWPPEVQKEWFLAFNQMMNIGESPHSPTLGEEDTDSDADSE